MVLNSAKKIRIVCGNHGDNYENEMYVHEAAEGKSVFYTCPKYVSILAKEPGKSCNNRLSINEYLKMQETLMNEKYTDDGQEVSTKGFRWTDRGIDYKVIEEKDGIITVSMKNRRAIGR